MGEQDCYVAKRHVLVFFGHIGFCVIYAIRINISVALVAMVDSTYAHVNATAEPECSGNKTTDAAEKDGEFMWNQNQQALILSLFSFGYIFTQIPGGIMAKKYSGKWVFGIGVLVSSLLTLLTPIAARTSIYLLYAVRFLIGLSQGTTTPAMYAVFAKWIPNNERSALINISHAGIHSGTVIGLSVGGLLCTSSFLGGWPSVFYVFGFVGVVWFAFWTIYVSDSPQKHPSISNYEKMYIVDSQRGSAADTMEMLNAQVPWFEIFTSVPVWATTVAHFSNNWLWYLILTDLPSYYKQVLNFNLTENGLLSALPFVAAFIAQIVSGFIADYLIQKSLSVTNVRRILGMLGFYPAAICLILASYTGCGQASLSVTYMVLSSGFLCLNQSSFGVNHLDLSPRFTGILMGITNCFGSMAGATAPLVTGYFTNNEQTRQNYRTVFIIAATVCIIGGSIFTIFVSGEQQGWNKGKKLDASIEHSSDEHVPIIALPSDGNVKRTTYRYA